MPSTRSQSRNSHASRRESRTLETVAQQPHQELPGLFGGKEESEQRTTDSATYVSMKQKACAELGMTSFHLPVPADVTQAELEKLIKELNPLPKKQHAQKPSHQKRKLDIVNQTLANLSSMGRVMRVGSVLMRAQMEEELMQSTQKKRK